MKRTPKLFKLLSARACKIFKKFLDPRPERRLKTLSDVQKYLDDRWLGKSAEKDMAENEPDELCPSMYSFHSSVDEKNRLLSTLAQCGIETTVDRMAKKNRIRDWIQSSVIVEEEEEDDSGTATPTSSVSRTAIPGHVSSVAAMEREEKKINSTVKDASQKHIDPRTGTIQLSPSTMGSVKVTQAEKNMNDQSGDKTSINKRSDKENGKFNSNRFYDDSVPVNPMVTTSTASASQGLVKAFNSVAAVTVPEINKNSPLSKYQERAVRDSGYAGSNGNAQRQNVLPKRSAMIKSNNKTHEEDHMEEEDREFLDDVDDFSVDREPNGHIGSLGGRQLGKDSPYDKIFFRRK